jgi:hypothetical protein
MSPNPSVKIRYGNDLNRESGKGVVRPSGPVRDTSQSRQEPIIYRARQIEQIPVTTTAPRYVRTGMLKATTPRDVFHSCQSVLLMIYDILMTALSSRTELSMREMRNKIMEGMGCLYPLVKDGERDI